MQPNRAPCVFDRARTQRSERLALVEPCLEVVAGPQPRIAVRALPRAERRMMRQREPGLLCFLAGGESPEPLPALLLGLRVDSGLADHSEALAALDNAGPAQTPSPLSRNERGGSERAPAIPRNASSPPVESHGRPSPDAIGARRTTGTNSGTPCAVLAQAVEQKSSPCLTAS